MSVTRVRLLVLAALPCLTGCYAPGYSEADEHYFRNEPESLEAAYREAIEDRGRNALLGVEKLLAAALLRHDWENAESLAIRASTLCNIFVADEGAERDALSLFGHEGDKPFKGEPHERVMVDFYLGILRLRRGELEEALAAFRSAMQKDRGSFLLPVTAEEARRGADNAERYLYDSDYALLEILAAKCYALLDEPDEARWHEERALAIQPPMQPLYAEILDASANVLVVIEGGRAPHKIRTGPQGSILGYRPAPADVLDRVALGGRELSSGQLADLYQQATTLGGRQVDSINRDKAAKQEALHLAGFATTAAAMMATQMGAMSRNRNMEVAGLIGIGVGIAAMIIAATAIDPSADLRAWTTLPGQIHLAAGRVEPGRDLRLEVEAHGDGPLAQVWTGVPVGPGINLYWIRLLPGRTGGAWTPPASPAAATPAPNATTH